jgi:hypothetical protein
MNTLLNRIPFLFQALTLRSAGRLISEGQYPKFGFCFPGLFFLSDITLARRSFQCKASGWPRGAAGQHSFANGSHYGPFVRYLAYSVRRFGRPTECPEVAYYRGVWAPQMADLGLNRITGGLHRPGLNFGSGISANLRNSERR